MLAAVSTLGIGRIHFIRVFGLQAHYVLMVGSTCGSSAGPKLGGNFLHLVRIPRVYRFKLGGDLQLGLGAARGAVRAGRLFSTVLLPT